MNIKYTSGLVLLLVGILGIPLAVLFYRELSSAAPTPTPQIRLLDSPQARITSSVPEVKAKRTPKPKPTRKPKRRRWIEWYNCFLNILNHRKI